MIRTTFKVSKIRMVCWIAALAALGAIAPVWATEDAFTTQDITKFVRDAGPGSYTVTLGTNAVELASGPVTNAFNGVTGGDAKQRVLLQ